MNDWYINFFNDLWDLIIFESVSTLFQALGKTAEGNLPKSSKFGGLLKKFSNESGCFPKKYLCMKDNMLYWRRSSNFKMFNCL